ncbi:MAG: hypothetical protein JNJ82_04210 [Opitutaceae bacterium]|nr:hypothetical protein [Opitutaceae bacterium]
MTEHEQLLVLCRRLGAAEPQAEIMARQLAKRCDQLMAERGMERIAALTYLLQLVTQGRSGVPPPGFEGTAPPPPAPGSDPAGTETR